LILNRLNKVILFFVKPNLINIELILDVVLLLSYPNPLNLLIYLFSGQYILSFNVILYIIIALFNPEINIMKITLLNPI